MKFEIEIDGVNAPIEDVENAIKDILYNQLDMELGVDYNKFKVNVMKRNDKHNEKMVKESSNVEKFRRSIEDAKNRIIRKVDRNGVVENLGADEVRRLSDDIDNMFLSGDCEKSDELKMIRMLDNFEYWLSTYTGKIVKESRKPHMWAVDFRNMNTAVHGLFYGADRKEVQLFYNNLKDLNSEEMDGYELEDLMNAYNSIKMIDEINFSRIGRLDSGRYGIEIDDVEYWIINYVSEDLYMESTKSDIKMKCKECGTMKKINEEIDIGWDLEARRDSDIQHSR